MRRSLRSALGNKAFHDGPALALGDLVRPIALAFAFALFGCSGSDEDFFVAAGDPDALIEDSVAEVSPIDSAVPDTSVPDDSMSVDTSVGADTAEDAVAEVAEEAAPTDASDASDADAMDDAASDTTNDATADAVTQLDAILADVVVSVDVSLPCDVKVSCWVDKDGDGYAVASAPIVACACPPGTASRDPSITIDCNDENPLVHPGALTFHDTPYCVLGSGCASQSFDYDCSGAEEPLHGATFAGCGAKSAGCPGLGWTGGVPPCGGSGTFVTCKASLLACDMSSAPTTQLCR